MDLYIPPYRINNEQIFTPTKAALKQPRTVKAEQYRSQQNVECLQHVHVLSPCLYMDLYIPPYRINNEQIFTPTKEAVLKQPRTVKAEQ